MPSVPVDGRRQYSMADVVVANVSLGRMPFAGVEEVFPGRYVVAGSWPKPTSPGGSGFSGRRPRRRSRRRRHGVVRRREVCGRS